MDPPPSEGDSRRIGGDRGGKGRGCLGLKNVSLPAPSPPPAFGVLKRRFCILKRPAHLYDRNILHDVVLACIILHNMIVEDEKKEAIVEENLDANVAPSSATVAEPETCPELNPPLERALENDTNLRDRNAHLRLKEHLVEHIWNKFGGRTHISTV